MNNNTPTPELLSKLNYITESHDQDEIGFCKHSIEETNINLESMNFYLQNNEFNRAETEANRVIELKRRPVCLKCGGNKVQAIELPSNAGGSIPIKIGIKHPKCSGNLKVHGSDGVRLGMNPIKYIYDIYGKLTSTIEGYDN